MKSLFILTILTVISSVTLAKEQSAGHSIPNCHTLNECIQAMHMRVTSNWYLTSHVDQDIFAMIGVKLSVEGELLNVTIVESSGNKSFDTRAIATIEESAPFSFLKGLPKEDFESHFSDFNFKFVPIND